MKKMLTTAFLLFNISTMKLQEYIEARRLSMPEAAKQLGISRGYLYMLISNGREAGKKTAFKIIEWSQGMIRLEDLWKEKGS